MLDVLFSQYILIKANTASVIIIYLDVVLYDT